MIFMLTNSTFVSYFIQPELHTHPKIGSQSRSDAMEFITNTITNLPTSSDSATVTTAPTSLSDPDTEYAQLQVNWMETLYANIQVTPFPECVKHLLSHSSPYYSDENLSLRNTGRFLSKNQNKSEYRPVHPKNATDHPLKLREDAEQGKNEEMQHEISNSQYNTRSTVQKNNSDPIEYTEVMRKPDKNSISMSQKSDGLIYASEVSIVVDQYYFRLTNLNGIPFGDR